MDEIVIESYNNNDNSNGPNESNEPSEPNEPTTEDSTESSIIRGDRSINEFVSILKPDEIISEIINVEDYIHRYCLQIRKDVFRPQDNIQKQGNMQQLIVYRGIANKAYADKAYSYSLVPSVLRGKNGGGVYESFFYHEIERFAPSRFSECSLFDKLCIMQHYSLPTRLLDLTTNPLVALYFACKNNNEKEEEADGQVIALEGNFYYSGHPEIQYLCAIPEFTSSDRYKYYTYEDMKDFLNNKGLGVVGEEILKKVCKFKYVGVIPNISNERLQAQQGVFLLFGLGIDNRRPENDDAILQADTTVNFQPFSCVIPKKFKADILNELKTLGIHQATLFHDLDNIAEYVVNTVLSQRRQASNE